MKKVIKMKVKSRTRSLSNYEQNVLLPILMKGLEMKKGKTNAVTSDQIVMGVRNQSLKINSSSVEMIINYIRMNDLIVGLMGSARGYYIISSEQEFIDYENNLMGREAALRKVRLCIERQRRTMFTEDKKVSQKKKQLF